MLKKVLIVLAVFLVMGSLLTVLVLAAGAALIVPWTVVRGESQPTPVEIVPDTTFPRPVPAATYTPYVTAEPSPAAGLVAAPDAAKNTCMDPVTLTAGVDGRVSYRGISFALAPELGGQVEAWECPTAFIDPNDFFASHPAFVAFRFPINRERIDFQPELYIYRVEGDMSQYRYPMSALDALRGALDQQPEPAAAWFKAPLKIHGSYVPFAGGKGVRGVVQYAQNYFFFTNNALLYDFHGLTDDGRFYVHMQYPLAAPFLMDLEHGDWTKNVNPQAIPIPAWTGDYAAMNQVITDYNNEALRRFDQMGEDGFAPHLSLMDGLIASLRVK